MLIVQPKYTGTQKAEIPRPKTLWDKLIQAML
jgi:hypothetical protein